MKKAILLLFISFQVFSQSYTIKGRLTDTTGVPLEFATLFLLEPSDSTMITFGRSDAEGKFDFKGVKKSDVVLQATFVGYIPLKKLVKFNPDQMINDLGDIPLKPIDNELFEVIVRTAKAPMVFKGDTVEYDAGKFKVPPGSTVEDLLRRLPGFQVDEDGNIKAQGQNITKVLVGGKRFFGNDPKAATKNLPSEAVSKVQVFDDSSEKSKVTGVNDGEIERTVNLELKDDFKKGAFGKLSAGAGTEDRVLAKGNYNRFDDKNQLSIIGFGNNISQSGLSSDDYQDFRGSQSYNWGNNVDFGFANSGVVISFGSGSDDNFEGLSIPQSYGPDRGTSKNYAGGLNYNYDTKKNKISSNYFYNNTSQKVQQETFRNIFLQGTIYSINSNENYLNAIGNHRGSIRYERELDSLRSVIAYVNGRMGDRTQKSDVFQDFINKTNEKFRSQNPYSSGDGLSKNIESSALFRNNFKKKGRSLLWSGTYTFLENDQETIQQSDLEEWSVNGESFPITDPEKLSLNQLALNDNQSTTLKTSLMYVEPIGKTLTWDIFTNLRHSTQKVARDIFTPPTQETGLRDQDLSLFYDNIQNYKRLGSSVRYTNKGIFAMVGLAVQDVNLDGKIFDQEGGVIRTQVTNSYPGLLPTFSFRYSFSNSSTINISASRTENIPTINQLQPFIDNANPMFITTGNPNLKPYKTNTANLFYNYYDMGSFFSIFALVNYRNFENQIVYNKTIHEDLSTFSSPENIKNGGNAMDAFTEFNVPVKKNKVTIGIGVSGNLNQSPIYLNEMLNTGRRQGYGISGSLNITPISWFSWFLRANMSRSYTEYSIFTQQNQTYNYRSLSSDMNIQFPQKIFLTSRLDYSYQKNDKIGLNQHLPILGVNVYKIFGKKNQHEIRLSGTDLFNKGFRQMQSSTGNEVYYTNTSTLSRYIMLSYSFNIRGMKTRLKQNQWE